MQNHDIQSNKNTLNIKFGKRIKQLRQERNMSQEEFAWFIGVHRTYIGQVERAEKNITLKNIEKICIALKMDPKELFNFDELN